MIGACPMCFADRDCPKEHSCSFGQCVPVKNDTCSGMCPSPLECRDTWDAKKMQTVKMCRCPDGRSGPNCDNTCHGGTSSYWRKYTSCVLDPLQKIGSGNAKHSLCLACQPGETVIIGSARIGVFNHLRGFCNTVRSDNVARLGSQPADTTNVVNPIVAFTKDGQVQLRVWVKPKFDGTWDEHGSSCVALEVICHMYKVSLYNQTIVHVFTFSHGALSAGGAVSPGFCKGTALPQFQDNG